MQQIVWNPKTLEVRPALATEAAKVQLFSSCQYASRWRTSFPARTPFLLGLRPHLPNLLRCSRRFLSSRYLRVHYKHIFEVRQIASAQQISASGLNPFSSPCHKRFLSFLF